MIGISVAPSAHAAKQARAAKAAGVPAKPPPSAGPSAFAVLLKNATRGNQAREGRSVARERPPEAQGKKVPERQSALEARPRKREDEPILKKTVGTAAEAALVRDASVAVQQKSSAPQPVVRESISTSSADGRSSATPRRGPEQAGVPGFADVTEKAPMRNDAAVGRPGLTRPQAQNAAAKEAPAENAAPREERRQERSATILVRDLRAPRPAAANPPIEDAPKREAVKEVARESNLVGITDRDGGGRIRTATIVNIADPVRPRMLSDEARERIVSDARIILRNNDEGEIRLVLKPESLGRVRVKLELHDHRVEGRFYVENSSVQEMFEQGLENLARSFRENGFEIGSLEVSVDQGRGKHDGAVSNERPAGNAAVDSRVVEEHSATVFDGNAVNILV